MAEEMMMTEMTNATETVANVPSPVTENKPTALGSTINAVITSPGGMIVGGLAVGAAFKLCDAAFAGISKGVKSLKDKRAERKAKKDQDKEKQELQKQLEGVDQEALKKFLEESKKGEKKK